MLKMTEGCTVPKADMLSEQYEILENKIIANVNADKIEAVIRDYILMHDKPMFFFLEFPTNQRDEEKLRKNDTDPRHIDVYYIDGLNTEQALDIFSKYRYLLINDGMSRFGFGVHGQATEIMRDKYNMISLLADNVEKYTDIFNSHNIPRCENLVTAWNTFSYEFPGECNRMTVDGKTVYDLPEELKDFGIYFAERREEY
ncbi:MAG: hypothetical protein K2J72_01795 [Oscillospiraceae bacterium]|nr:hypothetical protein [Oscillospiraceae bacterium]